MGIPMKIYYKFEFFNQIILVTIAFLVVLTNISIAQSEEEKLDFGSWKKAIILNDKIYALLPTLTNVEIIDDTRTIFADITQNMSKKNFAYFSKSYRIAGWFTKSNIVDYPHLFENNGKELPTSWCITSNFLFMVKSSIDDSSSWQQHSVLKIGGFTNSMFKDVDTDFGYCEFYFEDEVIHRKVAKKNKKWNLWDAAYEPDPTAIIYYQIECINDNKIQMFLLQREQFLVW